MGTNFLRSDPDDSNCYILIEETFGSMDLTLEYLTDKDEEDLSAYSITLTQSC